MAARSKSPAVSFTIDKSGDFFKYDPRRTFRQNIRGLMDELAQQAEGEVKARAAGAGREGTAVIPHIRGRTSSLRGKRWAVSLVVSPNTSGMTKPQAVRIMAIAAGHHNPRGSDGRSRGTTLGVEGKTKAWARTRRGFRIASRAAAEKLLKRIA